MTRSRTLVGAVLGILAALVWQILGGEALLWTLVLGVVGAAIGHLLDSPGRLIEYLNRLDR